MKMKAVIFDIDDTLYPYAPCDAAGTENMMNVLSEISGHIYDEKEFTPLLSQAKDYVKKRTSETAACHNRVLYSQRLCEMTECLSAENVLALYNAYWDSFLEKMKLFDGAYELLCGIKERGIKIGFCTDLTAHIQMRKLIRLGISDIADGIVTSEESGAEKPSEIPFGMILEKLGVSASEAVMIGDDYKKDILGAEAVGMKAIQFGNKHHHRICVSDYRELADVLKGMME